MTHPTPSTKSAEALPEPVQTMLNLSVDVILALRNCDRQPLADIMTAATGNLIKWANANHNAQACLLADHTARAAPAEKRVAELEAARLAYASEFPLNADGESDVGNIHANIRALKASVTARAAQPDEGGGLEAIAQSWDGCMYDAPGETIDIGADLRRAFVKLTARAAAPVQSVGDDTHLRSLFGNMHPLSVECILSYIKENYIDSLLAARPSAAPEYDELVADLKTTRATIRIMDENKARYLARIAELEGAHAAQVAVPRLLLALPDWEDRTIMIASDETIDGERLVCVSIKDVLPASSQAEPVSPVGAVEEAEISTTTENKMNQQINQISKIKSALLSAMAQGKLRLVAGVTGIGLARLEAIANGDAMFQREALILQAHLSSGAA